MLRSALPMVAVCAVFTAAQENTAELLTAKALDQEIRNVKNLSEADRTRAIKDLARRIRRQSPRYAVPLAINLVTDGTDGSGHDTVQEIADTLVYVLSTAHNKNSDGDAYRKLAELAHYENVRVSVNHPQYYAAMRELDSEDQHRRAVNFTLMDLQGRAWTLTALRGKTVLVNFWATWCPPCRRELPDLQAVYTRFQKKGFVVLAISDEDHEVVSRFTREQNLSFPVLLDPGQKVRKAFLVNGIPVGFVYDRAGKLAAQTFGQPNTQRLLEMLGKAGLR